MRTILWTVAACATLLWIGTAQAVTSAQQKCQLAKLKADGKLEACLKKQRGNVILGRVDASADCQTKFQAALTKADAKAASKATSCRYIDTDSGTTITDLNTGLVWEKKTTLVGSGPNPADPHDVDNIYTWSSSGTTPNGTAFTDFLGTLDGGTSSNGSDTVTPCFTGHCDWRLPTVQELAAIVDPTRGLCGGGSGACIDSALGPTQAFLYWSATTADGFPTQAWSEDFSTGGVSRYPKIPNNLYVRAVRGGL